MTATHILSRWRRVRGVLKTPSMWFTLLSIAEAGKAGISRTALAERTSLKCASLTYSLRILRNCGLVTEHVPPRTNKYRAPTISTITPIGLEFLGLKEALKEALKA